MKTIRKDTLKKMVEAGKLECKCEIHLTDDYRYDVANDFGKTEWKAARIRHPKFEKVTLYNGNEVDTCTDSDVKDGFINLMECEINMGRAYWNGENQITLRVHSNLYYTLRVIES